jgi:CRP-like cAMP-binding protein
MTASSQDAHASLRANRLLASLPHAASEQLLQTLEPVTLQQRQVLYEPGAPLTAVYFPVAAVISLLTPLEDGPAVESALVGREGVCGLALMLGVEQDSNRAVAQVPGAAFRLAAAEFSDLVAREPALRVALSRYTHVLLVQLAQSVACNGAHRLEQRCARRLLETQYRTDLTVFSLTHGFLASMLGVRRPSISLALARLQQAGLVRSARGQIAVLDQSGLEAAACSCYRTVRRLTDALLPEAPAAG